MATIVGDKIKLANYSYILNKEGNDFIPELYQQIGLRDRNEKVLDSVDIDWRPFPIYNFTGTDEEPAKYIDNGFLQDTEILIRILSYAYSYTRNMHITPKLSYNYQADNISVGRYGNRDMMITNLYFNTYTRKLSYTWFPTIGAVDNYAAMLTDTNKYNYSTLSEEYGEIFNNYKSNRAKSASSHAEGNETVAGWSKWDGVAAHAEGNNSVAIRNYTHAEGNNTFAYDIASHSEGDHTVAYAPYSHSEGFYTYITNDAPFSHVEGAMTYASYAYSHSEGSSTLSYNTYTHTEGRNTVSYGSTSHAEGWETWTQGVASHAEGYNTYSIGNFSHSEGSQTFASYGYTHSEGYKSIAYNTYSHVEGRVTLSYGVAGHAEGGFTYVYGNYGHAEGHHTYAAYSFSHAQGGLTFAYNTYAHSEGHATLASGISSHAEGDNTIAGGEISHAEGFASYALGTYSHAESLHTCASGKYSHAEGAMTYVSGESSHAEGIYSYALGDCSHVEGFHSYAIGNFSHASGWNTYASGIYSHSEGNHTIALGTASHVEGQETVALGLSAHSEGGFTYAYGISSHVEGFYTTTYFNASHAEGQYTYAYGEGAHSEGNKTYTLANFAHSEGNETISNGIAAHTEGSLTYVKGYAGHSEGFKSYVLGDYGHAEGSSTYASYAYSHSEGCMTLSYNTYAHVEGKYTVSYGLAGHSEGIITWSQGEAAHSEGKLTYALGKFSHAEGYGSQSYASYTHTEGEHAIINYIDNADNSRGSHAEGYFTYIVNGKGSHVEGDKSYINGNAAHAEGFKTAALNNYAHAEGYGTYAYGEATHSEGSLSYAYGDFSHVEGWNTYTYSSSTYAHAEGVSNVINNSVASHAEGCHNIVGNAPYGHSEGVHTKSTGIAAHTEGSYTFANANNAHASGLFSYSFGLSSHSEGSYTKASGHSAHAEGFNTYALGNFSHSEGASTYASYAYSHAEGYSTLSYNTYTHVEGKYTVSYGLAAHSEGIRSWTNGDGAHAEGFNTYASYNYSHSEGDHTLAYNQYTHVEGTNTVSYGVAGHAEGNQTYVYGDYAHAEGEYTKVTGEAGHAEGNKTYVLAKYGHSEGDNTYINGDSAHAEGRYSYATGIAAHVEGNCSYATGNHSHAEGNNTLASGAASHAQGNNSLATGTNSFSAGQNTKASATNAVAIGHMSYATGNDSVSLGMYNNSTKQYAVTIGDHVNATNHNSEFAIGKYNVSTSGYCFTLGDGTSTQRHNAMMIDNNGWTYISALASYINNITITYDHHETTYTENFVNLFSYTFIDRGVGNTSNAYQNTYNIKFTTYTIPTKNYIDRLLEAKDVFRFAGTFTFSGSTPDAGEYPDGTGDGNLAHNPTGPTLTITWNPVHNSNTYEEDKFTYYAYDGKIGAIWRATNAGYFGTEYVASGDMIIAYADHANPLTNNNTGWAVIDTHVNYITNAPLLKTNQNEKDRVITSIHLKDDGTMSYTYAPLVVKDTWEGKNEAQRNLSGDTYRFNGFISNFAINTDDNKIEFGYVRSTFKTVHGPGTANNVYGNTYDYTWDWEAKAQGLNSRVSSNEDKVTFIENIHLDNYGVLSYGTLTLNNVRKHHYNEGVDNTTYHSRVNATYIQKRNATTLTTYNQSENITNDNIAVVTNVYLNPFGHLSYSYTYVHGLKGHHNTYFEPDKYEVSYVNSDADVTEGGNHHVDELTVVGYVNLNKYGTLSYAYHTIKGLRSHHENHTYTNTYSINVDANGADAAPINVLRLTYISDVHMTNDGRLSYMVSTYTVNNLRTHHHTVAEVCYISGDNDYKNLNVDAATTDLTNFNRGLHVLTYAHITSDGTFHASYAYISNIRKHHHTLAELENTSTTGRKADTNKNERSRDVYNSNDTLKVLTYTYINDAGFLQTYYANVSNLRNHHKSAEATSSYTINVDALGADKEGHNTLVFTYSHKTYLTTDGLFGYTTATYTVTNLRKHHHTVPEFAYTNGANEYKSLDVDAAVNTTDYNRNLHVLTYAYITTDGTFHSYYATISNLRKHHHTLSELENTSTTGRKADANKNERSRDVYGSNDELKVITYAYINNTGHLQTYYANINNLLEHHKSSKATDSNSIDVDAGNNVLKFTYISKSELSKDGIFAYTVSTYTISNLKTHHHTAAEVNGGTADSPMAARSDNSEKNINVYGSNQTAKVISYVFLDKDGILHSSYYEITNLRNHHKSSKATNSNSIDVNSSATGDNGFKISYISKVELSQDGTLSYTVSTYSISNLRKHHHLVTPTGATASLNINTCGHADNAADDLKIIYVDGISFDDYGYLSYHYTTYSVSNLANHHSNTGTEITNGSINVNGASGNVDNFKFTYIAGVHITTDGKLTYAYSSYTITNLRNHHTGSKSTGDTTTTPNFNGSFTIIDSVSLSSSGKLDGTLRTIKIPNLTTSGSSSSYSPMKFIRQVGANSSSPKQITYVEDDIWGAI